MFEDSLSVRNFGQLAQFIEGYSGIKMPLTKRTMVEGRLRRRVKALGLQSLADYCRYLFDQGGLERETIQLIDAVTTNKTEFFREPDHFSFLAENVLPTLEKRGNLTGERPLRIWCAASSIGAEPYTLAMVADDWSRTQRGVRFDILATDISTRVLEAAVNGIYSEAMIEPVPLEWRQRYFMRAKDPGRHEVRVIPRLRQAVRFGRLNLMDDRYPVPDQIEVIFCRNILIYFDRETQMKVLGRMCQHLVPGGFLFVGHAETVAGHDLPVRPVANSVFQRI